MDEEYDDKVYEDELIHETDPRDDTYCGPHDNSDKDKVIDLKSLREMTSWESDPEELTDEDDVREVTFCLLEQKGKGQGTRFMTIMYTGDEAKDHTSVLLANKNREDAHEGETDEPEEEDPEQMLA